jgi:hypothetical protein
LPQQLRRTDLGEAVGFCVTPHQRFERAQGAVAARVPEHHPGGLLLKVEEVHAAAYFSVIILG